MKRVSIMSQKKMTDARKKAEVVVNAATDAAAGVRIAEARKVKAKARKDSTLKTSWARWKRRRKRWKRRPRKSVRRR